MVRLHHWKRLDGMAVAGRQKCVWESFPSGGESECGALLIISHGVPFTFFIVDLLCLSSCGWVTMGEAVVAGREARSPPG